MDTFLEGRVRESAVARNCIATGMSLHHPQQRLLRRAKNN
jgi:hypothetical protein